MVTTRSRHRSAHAPPFGRGESGLPSSLPPLHSSHLTPPPPTGTRVSTERVWRQRRLVLQQRPAQAGESTPGVTSRVLPSADDALTLHCLDHSPHTREFICHSSAPLFTPSDAALLALLTLALVASTALGWARELSAALVMAGVVWVWTWAQRVVSESVLCVAGLGLTLSRVYVTGRRWERFIDWANVEAVVINEAMQGWRLVDVLCVVERRRGGGGEWGVGRREGWVDGRRVVVLFEGTRPRLCTVRAVYRRLLTG